MTAAVELDPTRKTKLNYVLLSKLPLAYLPPNSSKPVYTFMCYCNLMKELVYSGHAIHKKQRVWLPWLRGQEEKRDQPDRLNNQPTTSWLTHYEVILINFNIMIIRTYIQLGRFNLSALKFQCTRTEFN